MSKSRRKTIGDDFVTQLNGSPLDLLTKSPQASNKKTKKNALIAKRKCEEKMERPFAQEKERITVQISKVTIERVKDCVYWNRLTVAQFVEEALEAALAKAEKANGKSFDKRRSELRPGRPTK